MESAPPPSPATTVYTSRLWTPLLFAVLVAALVAIAVVFLVQRWLFAIFPSGVSTAVLSAFLIVLVIGALVQTLCIRSITVTVSDQTVTVSRPGRRSVSVPRSDASFGTRDSDQGVDGRGSRASRWLTVTRVEGTRAEFNLGNFSADTFRELLAHLAPPRRSLAAEARTAPPMRAAGAPRSRAGLLTEQPADATFRIDASVPRQVARRLLSAAAVLAALSLASAAASVTVAPGSVVLLRCSLLIGGVAVLALLITAILHLRHARRFPGSITVGASGIQVDDERFPLEHLARVWVSVPFRRSRWIILARTDGRVTSFPLESGGVHLEMPYVDLVDALVRITAHRPSLFAFGLD